MRQRGLRVALKNILHGRVIAKGLMWAVVEFQVSERWGDVLDGPVAVVEGVELLLVGAVSSFGEGVELGRMRRSGEEPDASSRQAVSKSAWNSDPLSTWMARTGKGHRVWRASRMRVAVLAVAREAMSRVSHRETTGLRLGEGGGRWCPGGGGHRGPWGGSPLGCVRRRDGGRGV